MTVWRRDEATDNLILAAVAAVLMLTAQRFFRSPVTEPMLRPSPRQGCAAVAVAPVRTEITNPLRLPWAGWKQVLWRSYQRTDSDRLLATAAGVVFFGLLAVFPAITALVSCYGLVADPSTIGANLGTLALMLPDGSFQIV
jgi:membrane protein